MIDSFIISFKLKNTYKVNGIIYALKQIPLIKRLPASLYASPGLKVFSYIVAAMIEFGSFFLGKFLYLLLFTTLPLMFFGQVGSAEGFLHIFFFLTLIGTFLNTHMFKASKDKYYAMFLMGMDAKKFTLSNYIYFLFKTFVGFLPLTLAFGLAQGLDFGICLIMPWFVISSKVIFSAFTLRHFAITGKRGNEKMPIPVSMVVVPILLIAAYLPLYFGLVLNGTIFITLCLLIFVGALVATRYILRYREYRRVYKDLLTESVIIDKKDKASEITRNAYKNRIEVSMDEASSKTGYQYFNDLFVKRHRKLLLKSAKRTALILTALLVIATAACFLSKSFSDVVNNFILVYLPYTLFLMYVINRGKTVTQAMFMNCDHSMLSYRFYRQPKVILHLFVQRLKSLVIIDMLPSIVIAIGLPFLLCITGGTTNPLTYIIVFMTIIGISVFFSVHNLVLYYLLQPYNVNLEIKSGLYKVVDFLTYFVCYYAMGQEMSTLLFGTIVLIFSILYIIVSLFLVYKYAPKTFKLRR